ncbi:DUF3245 domain-containing protein [Aspergillus glaucus CBS 516.65]|uniref:Uncharacterized protein n=1 Tax=Aspergillus glaucus CBS 516.65 TaxID=1160497 RepID=A0A1L9VLR0_ASPGL|nr:hypothetical protein ASPGLDRAFT_125867 [Aspergillus glaucus CBS 516.65]OJJ84866.1 hypothetical protein ASPGLDRAFT_125867 [Aspergillus glaucus CBS 516.65]
MSSTDIILNRANVALARSQRLVASWLPPQTTEEQTSNTKSEEELRKEEDEIFTAVPETLGVGAPLPSKLPDGSWNRAELDSNDALRRQLLGRNYQKVMKEKEREREAKQKASATTSGDANNPSHSGGNNEAVEEDDYDEEDGRTAAVGRKFAAKGQGLSQGLTKNQKKKNNKKRKAAAEEQSQSQTPSDAAAVAPGGGDGDNPEQEKQEVEAQGDEQDSSAKPDAGTSGSSSRPAPRRKKATSFLDEILAERSKKRKKR